MADNIEDDDLLNDLLGNMDSSGHTAPAAKVQAPAEELKEDLFSNDSQSKQKFSKEKLLFYLKKTKAKVLNYWQLSFMILSFLAAIYVLAYLPKTIPEEDQIHEPGWWFEKAIHYYKIAEDKNLESSFANVDFSRYEFNHLTFEKQKELFEQVKQIKGFASTPNLKVQSQFISTFVNDLNKLLLEEKLIEKLPKEAIDSINSEKIETLKEELKKSSNASENNLSSTFTNNMKLMNRELLQESFDLIPKNKPARLIAARYFRYVFDKFPGTLKSRSAADILKVADTFYFVAGEGLSKKEIMQIYLEASHKNDPLLEVKDELNLGGQGDVDLEKNNEESENLSLEDQAHIEYMLANLYFDQGDNFNSQKYLDLVSEKASEGFDRRIETDIVFFNTEKKSILHREIKTNKINDAYFKLGNLQYKSNELEDAKKNLESFISKSLAGEHEKSFQANQILGDLFMSLKNYDKASLYFRKALNINSISSNQKNPVKFKMGLVYFQLGEYSKAIERFKQVNGTGAFGKNNASALFYIGKSYQILGDDEQSIEIFKNIRERFPLSDEDIAATFEVAKYHFKQGMYDEAYSEPIGKNHAKGSIHDYSIKTLLENPIERFLNNEFINVAEILVEPESGASSIGLLYDLANVFTAKKQYEKTIDVYTLMTSNPLTIHQMGAKRDKLYFDMAKIWAENGAPIRAGETLEIMLEKIPDSPFYSKALWDVCKYYMSKNDYGRAIKPLRLFTKTYYGRPESPESYYLLGLCEQKVGDFDRAIESYNMAYGYLPWKAPKADKELKVKNLEMEDPYYTLSRPENHVDRNFFAYQSICQKAEAYKDIGQYDNAIDQVYQTIFNDPLFRFTPTSEIWKRGLLIYADSYFYKGWQEKTDMKLKMEYFDKAEKSYLDYVERYKVTPIRGLGEEFEKLQLGKWEEFDTAVFGIYNNLAYIKFELKEYGKARDLYLKLIKWPMENWTNSNRDEKKKDAFLMLPLTYYKESKWSEAILAYRDAKDRYASSTEAPALGMRIAECLQQMGDFANAKLEFDASKWALELANANLFKNKPGEINKQYWDDLIRLKKNNLEWIQQNPSSAPKQGP